MLKKRMMSFMIFISVFAFLSAIAGTCIAGEANEGSGDEGYAQGVDDDGYVVDEGEAVDESIDLNEGSALRYFGSMAKCGDRSYYNPAYAYCANWATSLVCSRGMHACGGYTCYDPGYCTCTGSGRLSCRRYP